MKKTGTITFHASINNGSFLQAFALQKVLTEKLNVANEIIDLQCYTNRNLYKIFRPIKKFSDIFRTLVSVLHYKKLTTRNARFDNMRKKHLKLSKLFLEDEEALSYTDNYDCIIAGSDQIWNINAHDFTKAYFLPDVKTKKITYAVSCGSNVASMDLEKFSQEINSFKSVATRETASAKVISEIYKSGTVHTVLDPTLLLDKEQYNELYDTSKRLIKKPYIFFYAINYNKEVLENVKRISKLFKLPVVTVFTSYHTVMCLPYGVKVIYDAGPSEFLNLIQNAEYVLTNSFHGTAFSIIFEKNFYYLCKTDGEKEIKDDRINELLDKLHLEQNIYVYSSNNDILSKNITDYSHIDEQLDEMKDNSINYLQKTLL